MTVNDGYSRDEVLLNLDRIGSDVRPGILMSIAVIKNDAASKAAGYGSLNKQPNDQNAAAKEATPAIGDPDGLGDRYIFVARDMSKELKARSLDADISVAKHIADAFGIKRASQVLLGPVSLPRNTCTCPLLTPLS